MPTATTGSASEIQKTTATLNGTVNPEGALLEECKFEWGTSESYGQSQACDLTPAEIGEGTAPVAVKAEITGLSEATTYHFRLVAKNSEGTSNGADETFKTLSPPVVEAFATEVVYSEAILNASIDPEGFPTTYKIQWGPTAAYGSEVEGNAGEDKAVHQFSHFLEGLSEGATYHYRVVATNANGT
ncbi:MAG TPA: fibronectin type III domain-containing protein, partial [Solirubrobacterales bacterium]|nr:fibronectin type III domain-containing protein [Solirubrobacterales bacterium]